MTGVQTCALPILCLYCQHYCLLPLAAEQRVGQLVVWREVFPRHRAQDRDQYHRPGYLQPHGRYFLLIVGLVRTFIVKAYFAPFDIVYGYCFFRLSEDMMSSDTHLLRPCVCVH